MLAKLFFILLTAVVLLHVGETQPNVPNLSDMGIEMAYDSYRNWGKTINETKQYLIVYPKTDQEVASIVTRAHVMGKNVRVQGYRHTYAPITVSKLDDPHQVILIDMTRHMTRLRMGRMFGNTTHMRTLIAQPGASMQDFMTFAEVNGYGIAMSIVIGGDATVGGVLAIGGHGAGVPALNEKLIGPGFTFGSVSNLITELKAVVWDARRRQFVIKTFSRSDSDISAFIVHLGRAIITEVTLLVGRNYNMRCLSRVDVPASELFAHSENASALRSMTTFFKSTGRVDAIWFPFTENPWLRTWEVTNVKPISSRVTTIPYNYQFSSSFDNPQTPGTLFGPESYQRLIKGLTDDKVWDIWGPSKNTILCYNRTATPLVYSGFVILTNQANIQLVLHDMVQFYLTLLKTYSAQGRYPIDQYIKFRATGLDNPRETFIPGAVAPDISPISPVPTRPDFNIGVWMNTVTTTNRPYSNKFGREFEQWAFQRFSGEDALARPEWSKGWGFTKNEMFADKTFLRETIPKSFGISKWNNAVNILDKYDPHRVISNKFLRELMVPYKS